MLTFFLESIPDCILNVANLSDILLSVSTVLFIVTTCLAYTHARCGGNIPLIREASWKKRFSLKTRWAYYTDCAGLFGDAYNNFSKKGLPVWVPSLGTRNDILMPHKDLAWVLAQPPNIISIRHAYNEINGIRRSLGSDKYMLDNWQGMLVSKELNKVLDGIVLSMNDELKFALESRLGQDTANWKVLDLQKTVQLVVVQATSRFHVGKPLCRDEEYLHLILKIMDEMIVSAAVAGAFPTTLQPLISPIASWRLRRLISRVRKLIEPRFNECMAHGTADDKSTDFFQMMFRFAQKERPDELNLWDMTNRLCMANFEAIHQTSMAITNMILNIVSSDTEYDTISILRNETTAHLGGGEMNSENYLNDDKKWTKAKIANLVKVDSIARETMRLHSFANRGLFRKVMVDGVQTEDGISLPKGSILSFLSQPRHTDSDIFGDPLKFDPWRFSRAREQCEKNSATAEAAGTHALVSTSQLLSFGRGRNACPGRYLVDFEVKMIVSYLLFKYDIRLPEEYGGQRPQARWVAEASVIPKDARVMVRRRK
ncbi:hypothetical protein AJ78_00342 [Emergomyces pasteurianus Ep9510]|uniref:Cytochrome P450 n=1 Tax=Emergomyces pasteurianus Ep9510 TaxID=1447872 RepID=A0A1J9QU45_9EURO|nr:hypothetical protein AJ78_00342 [Emergomyces pasteurianus Ep9510]